jgi:hypothetical protein
MASFQDRVVGALMLKPATFEEVENDASATSQAAMVVAAAGVARGIANISLGGITGLVGGVVFSLIGWAIGSFVILMVGTKLFPGPNTKADMGQMLRVLGFAQAAGVFSVLGIIPLLGWLVLLVVAIWMLVASVIGVRQALDYDDTMKAVIVCVVAWVVMWVVTFIGGMLGFGGQLASRMA